MSLRVPAVHRRKVSVSLETAVQPPHKVLRFPAPNFASFAEAERFSAPPQPGGGFLLGVASTFAFEAIAALLLYGAWHLWKVFA